MLQSSTLKLALFFCSAFFILSVYGQQHNPNIIFILADDLGIGDVSSFNKQGKIQTPNIDRMARAGVQFTDAHSGSSVCTPTRYGILTGRYAWRTRLKSGVLVPYDAPLIEPDRVTMAGMLKRQGYHTAAFGKWHLGWNWITNDGSKPKDTEKFSNLDFTQPLKGGPLDIGFDYFFGVDVPNYPPYTYIENRSIIKTPSMFYSLHPYNDCRPGSGIEGWDLKAILPDLEKRSVDHINKTSGLGKPFFMYIALTAPHTPIAPSDPFKGSSGLNVYADFVQQVDHFVGAVLDALDESGVRDNTLVVFTSDNGCSPQADVDFLAKQGHNPSAQFRGLKADLFEGGHRVPLLVQWPEKIPNAFTVGQTICLNDFMATVASITGYPLNQEVAEDSYSMLPLLLNPNHKKTIREATVHHSVSGEFAIRKGKWKLLLTKGSGGWSYPSKKDDYKDLPPVQLYDLEADPGETNNVQHIHPGVVRNLKNLLTHYQLTGRSTSFRTSSTRLSATFIREAE